MIWKVKFDLVGTETAYIWILNSDEIYGLKLTTRGLNDTWNIHMYH